MPAVPVQPRFLWRPQPGPQTAVLARPEKEILYGGARGGGKSESGIIWVAVPAIARDKEGKWLHPYYRALVLRRHSEDLKDWIDRADRYYTFLGAKKIGRPPEFHFPSGAKILTGHLRDKNAYTKYIGHEYQRIVVEELTLIPAEQMYEQILGSCRSKYPGLPAQIFLTTNPGGPGHHWVRARFIIDEKGNKRIIAKRFYGPDNNSRIFIPATVDDNPILSQVDPGYIAFLDSIKNESLRRAWRYGDWDAFVGQYFSEFRPFGPVGEDEERLYPWARHVIEAKSVKLEPWWHRWMSGDWGFDHPAVVHWYCQHPNGQVHVYRELRIRQMGSKELGVKIARESAADLAAMPEPYMTLSFDPRVFAKTDEGPTQAQQIAAGIDEALGKGTAVLLDENAASDPRYNDGKARIVIRQASNSRVPGWMNIRDFLRFQKVFPDEQDILPKLQIWDSCAYVIDQLQSLVFDTDGPNPEDALKIDAVGGMGGDDAVDSLRYGLMAWKLRQNIAPMSIYVMEKLGALSRKYNGHVDPTIAYMVAERAEAEYGQKFRRAKPVTFRRLSGPRSEPVIKEKETFYGIR